MGTEDFVLFEYLPDTDFVCTVEVVTICHDDVLTKLLLLLAIVGRTECVLLHTVVGS